MKENYRIYDQTGSHATEDIFAPSLDEAIVAGIEWIEGGSWEGNGGELPCEVSVIVRHMDGEVDEVATADAERYDCSGVDHIAEPSCTVDEHDWVRVGGCVENPGVFSSNHGQICTVEKCKQCGMTVTTDYGATDMHGRRTTRTTFATDGGAA